MPATGKKINCIPAESRIVCFLWGSTILSEGLRNVLQWVCGRWNQLCLARGSSSLSQRLSCSPPLPVPCHITT